MIENENNKEEPNVRFKEYVKKRDTALESYLESINYDEHLEKSAISLYDLHESFVFVQYNKWKAESSSSDNIPHEVSLYLKERDEEVDYMMENMAKRGMCYTDEDKKYLEIMYDYERSANLRAYEKRMSEIYKECREYRLKYGNCAIRESDQD